MVVRSKSITYNEQQPFVLKDSNVQFRLIWHDEAPYGRDWSYSIATTWCSSEEDQTVVSNADVWSPGSNGMRWDVGPC